MSITVLEVWMVSCQIPNQTKHGMITCPDIQIPRRHIPENLDARAYWISLTKCHDKRKSEPATKMYFIQHEQSFEGCIHVIPYHFTQQESWING